MSKQAPKDLVMNNDLAVDDSLSPPHTRPPILVGVAVASLALAGSIALWMHYGTAVFFEMIRAGFIACFG
jgi:hypothetical protein